MREDIAAAWPDPKDLTWRKADGPLKALVMTLHDAGWTAPTSCRWIDPDGMVWELEDRPPDIKALVAHFAATVQKGLWARAATGHLGQGLQHGGDMKAVASMVNKLRRGGAHGDAGLCVAITAGGYGLRCAEAGYAGELIVLCAVQGIR